LRFKVLVEFGKPELITRSLFGGTFLI